MISSALAGRQFRYERKFVVPYFSKDEAEVVIKNNPFMFSEIYYERKINNIYFDSLEMDSYFDNVLGTGNRTKVRIRWYGDALFAKDPVLELKVKRGLVGTKLSYKLSSFSLDGLDRDKIDGIFGSSGLPSWLLEKLRLQRFSLYNSYFRKYFLSACGRFRATIDSGLTYAGVMQQSPIEFCSEKFGDYVIVEVKYDSEDDAERVTTHFPFRLTKSSKYVTGINMFRGD